jgi:predicted nuclease of predicted toxin-antitoxin system
MRILLDENLPQKLVAALRAEGHNVESVHTLSLQGLANGRLYEFACSQSFDICFTRDAGFAHNIRQKTSSSSLRLLRVTLQQKPQDEFVAEFISAFRVSDLTKYADGDDWP